MCCSLNAFVLLPRGPSTLKHSFIGYGFHCNERRRFNTRCTSLPQNSRTHKAKMSSPSMWTYTGIGRCGTHRSSCYPSLNSICTFTRRRFCSQRLTQQPSVPNGHPWVRLRGNISWARSNCTRKRRCHGGHRANITLLSSQRRMSITHSHASLPKRTGCFGIAGS